MADQAHAEPAVLGLDDHAPFVLDATGLNSQLEQAINQLRTQSPYQRTD